jgi:hypothetical protein
MSIKIVKKASDKKKPSNYCPWAIESPEERRA